jgi:hypothetical protein
MLLTINISVIENQLPWNHDVSSVRNAVTSIIYGPTTSSSNLPNLSILTLHDDAIVCPVLKLSIGRL